MAQAGNLKKAIRWFQAARDAMMLQSLFGALLLTFLILFVSETLWENSVYGHIDVVYVLIATVAIGALVRRMFRHSLPPKGIGLRFKLVVAMVGITVAAIVGLDLRDIGWTAYGFPLIAGATVVTIVVMVFDAD